MTKFNSLSEIREYFSTESFSKINSWKDFYIFLSSFYEENRSFFSKKDIKNLGIEKVVGLNPDNFFAETPEQSLESDKKHLSMDFDDSSILLIRIKFSIDNMFTSYSEKECPITGDYFRIVAVEEDNGSRHVLLECPTCYRMETPSGENIEKIDGMIFPVSKAEIKELEKNNVRILK